MKTVLEMVAKPEREGISKREADEIFYRYNVDGTIVWFTQYQESGNIYSVGVGVKEGYSKYFYFCPYGKSICYDYPTDIGLNINGIELYDDTINEYPKIVEYAIKLRNEINKIFTDENSIHYKLFKERHCDEI